MERPAGVKIDTCRGEWLRHCDRFHPGAPGMSRFPPEPELGLETGNVAKQPGDEGKRPPVDAVMPAEMLDPAKLVDAVLVEERLPAVARPHGYEQAPAPIVADKLRMHVGKLGGSLKGVRRAAGAVLLARDYGVLPHDDEIAHGALRGLKVESEASFSQRGRSPAETVAGTWILATA